MGRRSKGSQSAEVIPDEFRCKRSDGKSWRCSERAAEGKSMCEKHFKQAKKRAAASAARLSAAKRLKGERTKNKPPKETAKGTVRKRHKRLASSDTELESDDGSDASSDSPSSSPPSKRNSDDLQPLKRPRGASSFQNDPNSRKIDDSSNKVQNSVTVEQGESSGKRAKRNRDGDDSQGKSRKAIDDSEKKTKENDESLEKKARKNLDSVEKMTKHHSKVNEKADDPERKVRFKDEHDGKGSGRKIKENKEDYDRKSKQKHQNQDPKMGEMSQDFGISDESKIKGRPAASVTNAKDTLHHESNAVDRNLSSSEQAGEKSKDRNKCHQCQGTDKETTIHCRKCKSKQYCLTCISKWYPEMTEDDFLESCAACLGNCNCKACLRLKFRSTLKERNKPSDAERISTLRYILSFLLPLLKSLDKQQNDEMELEVKLKGISQAEMKRKRLTTDERLLCDNCNTPIVDLYRSCPGCNYDICVLCSQEIREGKLLCNKQVEPSEKVNNNCIEVKVWKANEDGSILCPPKTNGGCGAHEMILERIAKHGWISKLVADVEAAVGEIFGQNELFEPCKIYSAESVSSSDHRRCVYQVAHESAPGNSFIYCPSALDIDKKAFEHFQKHWRHGEPVIARDVLHNAKGLSWEPSVFLKAFQEKINDGSTEKKGIVKVLKCLDWREGDINIQQFFKGYQDGYAHKDGWPELLKLKDWPPQYFFYDCLSSHGTGFISVLPFHDYTHPTRGLLNLVTKIPDNVIKPNLGPKTHIGYGVHEELGRGDSVTKLHCGLFDTVNVLTHCTEGKVLNWHGKPREMKEENEFDVHVESTAAASSVIELQSQIEPKTNDFLAKEQKNSEEITSVAIDGVSEVMDSRVIQDPDENVENETKMLSQNVCAQPSEAMDGDHQGDSDMFGSKENEERSRIIEGGDESINNVTVLIEDKSSLKAASQNDITTSVQVDIERTEKVEHTETQQSGSIDGSIEENKCTDNPKKCLHYPIEDVGYSELLASSVENQGIIDVASDVQVNSLDGIQQKTFPSEIINENGCKEASTDVSIPVEQIDHGILDISVENEEIKPFENTVLKDCAQEDPQNDENGGHVTGMSEEEGKASSFAEVVDGFVKLEGKTDGNDDNCRKSQRMSREHELDVANVHTIDAKQINLMDYDSQMIENGVENTQSIIQINSNISGKKEQNDRAVLENSTLEIPDDVKPDYKDAHDQGTLEKQDCYLKAEPEDHLSPVKNEEKGIIPDREINLGSVGVLWDVFHREDVPKLQMYLEKHWREFQRPEEKFHASAILDQSIFLTHEHKRKLKEEYGVEAWTIEQHTGEAVFIPAGCPYQARNMQSCISVALDFVSPESVQETARLVEEYRRLPKGHHAKEDELEVKRMVIFAAAAVLKQLNHSLQLQQKPD